MASTEPSSAAPPTADSDASSAIPTPRETEPISVASLGGPANGQALETKAPQGAGIAAWNTQSPYPGLDTAASNLTAAIQKLTSASVPAATPSGVKDINAAMAQKKAVRDAAHAVLASVEEPQDVFFEWAGTVGLMTCLRLLWEWKVIEAIPDEGSASYAELAEKTGTEEKLLKRVIGVPLSYGRLVRTSDGRIAHSPMTRAIAGGPLSGGTFFMTWENGFVPYAQYPQYFAHYGRHEPREITHVPNTYAFGHPELDFYELLRRDPPRMARFMPAMQNIESRMPIAGIYDFTWLVELAEKTSGEEGGKKPLFVDVGGGQGQAIKAIHHEFPGLPLARCVLEDRPEIIQLVEKMEDPELKQVQKVAIDFHKGQPLKGAPVYWIRRCCHNYSDELVVNMLRILAEAAGPGSRVLINEDILDDPPHQMQAWLDFMMLGFGGKQRSIDMWDKMLSEAGLKRTSVSRGQGPWRGLGVLEAVKV